VDQVKALLQGEYMGQRINTMALVEYELLSKRTLNVEADDVAVIGLRSAESGEDMLEGEGENYPELSDRIAYLYRCGQRAAADHAYESEIEAIDAARELRQERALTGAM
jgi:hypothetical protein